MKHFLKLIRILNLAIVVFTIYAMRHGIIIPVYAYFGFEPILSELQFLFLALSSVFLTGGGYIINDYFDRKADMINHPETVVVGIKLKRRWAIVLHSVFNTIAIVCGFAISYSVGIWWLGFIFVGISFILWLYSIRLKKLPLTGNLTVSILTGLVPIFVMCFEYLGIRHTGTPVTFGLKLAVTYSGIIILGFSVFAFLLNLMREIVKDIEDIRGDIASGCKTLPIVIGKKNTNILVSLISFVSSILVIIMYFFYLKNLEFMQNDALSLWYIIALIIAPLLFITIRILFARYKKEYKIVSHLLKFTMFTGIVYSIIINIIVTGNIL
jgi:4-hydroxybenzoate polyprenyltransferase